jgi:hypothetical protein
MTRAHLPPHLISSHRVLRVTSPLPAPLSPSSVGPADRSDKERGDHVSSVHRCSSRSRFMLCFAYVQCGIMPRGSSMLWCSGHRWWWWIWVLLAIALWRLETVMDDEAALPSLSNKLVVLLDAGFSLRSKRRGGEQRLLRSRGAIYGNSQSFSCRSSQSVARCTADILGRGGHSTCQGLVLLGLFFLHMEGSSG